MTRARFQGALQILSFHWRLYLVVSLCVAAGAIAAPRLFWLMAPAAFWLPASIAASHYIYDRSPLYRFSWLQNCLSRQPERWVNLHAGLDETSVQVAALFPESHGAVFDVFDPDEMTEPSIAQARRWICSQSRAADWRALPLADASCDAAFLIFTAHEFRNKPSRTTFFREVARVLQGSGDLIVVEHLRDWMNFLVFGPGFLHFLPQRDWLDAAEASGFEIGRRMRVTPFVHVFAMRKKA